MLRAGAKRLSPEPTPQVPIKKVKKVVINLDQVRRVLRVGGLIVVLTMVNASIQALVAQTQYRLKEVQAEIQVVDQKIGWLQFELASHISQQQIARLAWDRGEGEQMERNASVHLPPNLVLPPSILNIDPVDRRPEKTVTAKFYDWVSGIGRTLAKGVLDE